MHKAAEVFSSSDDAATPAQRRRAVHGRVPLAELLKRPCRCVAGNCLVQFAQQKEVVEEARRYFHGELDAASRYLQVALLLCGQRLPTPLADASRRLADEGQAQAAVPAETLYSSDSGAGTAEARAGPIVAKPGVAAPGNMAIMRLHDERVVIVSWASLNVFMFKPR